jgi:hypothetical protein
MIVNNVNEVFRNANTNGANVLKAICAVAFWRTSLDELFVIDESLPASAIKHAGLLELEPASVEAAIECWRSTMIANVDEGGAATQGGGTAGTAI